MLSEIQEKFTEREKNWVKSGIIGYNFTERENEKSSFSRGLKGFIFEFSLTVFSVLLFLFEIFLSFLQRLLLSIVL